LKRYIALALFAFVWLNVFSIPIGTSPMHPLLRQDRVAFAVRVGKDLLPTVITMNGYLDRDDRVYGIWMEDHRLYADFQLVGSIYGYGSHLVLNNVMLVDYLEELDCQYIMYDERRLARSVPYFGGAGYKVPTDNPVWGEYFEECVEFYPMRTRYDGREVKVTPRVKVWKLK